MKGERDVATLLRLAGRRPPVPAERLERAKAVAHTTWRREVRNRSWKRYLWTAGAFAAAASFALAMIFGVGDSKPVPPPGAHFPITVESLTGPVWLRDGTQDLRALNIDDDIPPGCELITADAGRLAIRLTSGHSIRLDRSTQVRLLDPGSLALDRGAIYVDSASDIANSSSLIVQTRFGVVQEIGTQFEVRLERDAIRVRLREGRVVLKHDAQTHEVGVGRELELRPNGSTTSREVSTYGAEWEWVAGITPMLDLESRTARTFLDWVARERGWRLVFSDETVARSAEEVVLVGNIDRMTLDQALDAVLPSCRMAYRVAGGVLMVDALPEDEVPSSRPPQGTRVSAQR